MEKLSGMKNIVNSFVAFVLEFIGLIVIGFWEFSVSGWLLGIGLPVIVMVVWGIWCAPSSHHRLAGIPLLFLKGLVLGFAVLCLFLIGQFLFAILFGVLVLVHLIFSYHQGII